MFPRFWGALVPNIVAPPSIRVKLIAKLHRPLRYPVADKHWSQHVSTAARLRRPWRCLRRSNVCCPTRNASSRGGLRKFYRPITARCTRDAMAVGRYLANQSREDAL
jgi:hypothetical protein